MRRTSQPPLHAACRGLPRPPVRLTPAPPLLRHAAASCGLLCCCLGAHLARLRQPSSAAQPAARSCTVARRPVVTNGSCRKLTPHFDKPGYGCVIVTVGLFGQVRSQPRLFAAAPAQRCTLTHPSCGTGDRPADQPQGQRGRAFGDPSRAARGGDWGGPGVWHGRPGAPLTRQKSTEDGSPEYT